MGNSKRSGGRLGRLRQAQGSHGLRRADCGAGPVQFSPGPAGKVSGEGQVSCDEEDLRLMRMSPHEFEKHKREQAEMLKRLSVGIGHEILVENRRQAELEKVK